MIRILESLLRVFAQKYLSRIQPQKIITITGSIGKTSTTKAIAHVLQESGKKVIATKHNYNTNLGVPASILGYDLPKFAKNPMSWLILLGKSAIKSFTTNTDIDYVVLELGTDKPGDISQFSWIKPDIAVITATTPEHMENFKSVENVAKEELSIGAASGIVLVNKSTVDEKFYLYAKNEELYHYHRDLLIENHITLSTLQVVGLHSRDALAAALWIAKHEGLEKESYTKALQSFTPPTGRMRIFEGKFNSRIIDDTYNSSPEAAIAALQHLYTETANHRIALLGNMNELGDSSRELHEKLGAYCNKTKLDLVVTLGPDANTYTAKSAEKNGCIVARAQTPQEAAQLIVEKLKSYTPSDNTVILCKGSQNRVYAEETVKLLLKNPNDAKNLVRQSKRWKDIKGTFWTVA